MRRRELKNVEWSIIIVAIILSAIGLIALFSATQEAGYDEFNKQCIWLGISIIAMVIILVIDYEFILKVSPFLYGIFIILLAGCSKEKKIEVENKKLNIKEEPGNNKENLCR